jgi:hypothetical protein
LWHQQLRFLGQPGRNKLIPEGDRDEQVAVQNFNKKKSPKIKMPLGNVSKPLPPPISDPTHRKFKFLTDNKDLVLFIEVSSALVDCCQYMIQNISCLDQMFVFGRGPFGLSLQFLAHTIQTLIMNQNRIVEIKNNNYCNGENKKRGDGNRIT